MAEANSGGSSTSLRLRARAEGGSQSEVFIIDGLTIGRSNANIVQVEGDDSGFVERVHARVEFSRDGSIILKCINTQSTVLVGDSLVSSLVLVPGLTFRIGSTEFSVTSGSGKEFFSSLNAGLVCPYCGSSDFPDSIDKVGCCPSCKSRLFFIPPNVNLDIPRLLPGILNDNDGGIYGIDSFVARGGMGYVLKAKDNNGLFVAIKIMIWDKGTNQQLIARFQQEIQLLKRLNDPNVLKLISSGQEAGLFFYAMEWVNGRDLRQVLPSQGKPKKGLNFSKAILWFEQACLGLLAIHRAGAVHRDIKPSNLLVTNEGKLLIADLGVAKKIGENETGMTSTGQLPGTYWYMAPEQQFSPDLVDHRTDMYSLAFTFWELLTGFKPNTIKPPRPSIVNPTVPREFDDLLIRMLSTNLKDRPANMLEILRALPKGKKNETPRPPTLALPIQKSDQENQKQKGEVLKEREIKGANQTKRNAQRNARPELNSYNSSSPNNRGRQFPNTNADIEKDSHTRSIKNLNSVLDNDSRKIGVFFGISFLAIILFAYIFSIILNNPSGEISSYKESGNSNLISTQKTIANSDNMSLIDFEELPADLNEIKVLTVRQAEKLALIKDSLVLNGLTSISPEVSQVIASGSSLSLYLDGLNEINELSAKAFQSYKGNLISLNGIKKISKEVALALPKKIGLQIELNGLSTISNEIASALSLGSGNLILGGLSKINWEVAEILAKNEGIISLKGLEDISESVAEALSKNKSLLVIKIPQKTRLSVFEELAKNKGLLFLLNSVDVPLNVAAVLANKEGGIGFQSIADTKVAEILAGGTANLWILDFDFQYVEIARCLSKKRLGILYLDYVKDMPADVAEVILEFNCSLSLGNVSEISLPLSNLFAKHDGRLIMDGVLTIQNDVAKSLAKHKGDLYLRGLNYISDDVAHVLSKAEGLIYLGQADGLPQSAVAILKTNKKIIFEN
jgi:serine/threonine protein kinase